MKMFPYLVLRTRRNYLLCRHNCYQCKTIKNTKPQKISNTDNIVCYRNLLLNETVVNNHIFSATANKIRKYQGCHENAHENGSPSSSTVVPFAVDTLGNFCSVAIISLKKLAKAKFSKYPWIERTSGSHSLHMG